jgi:hypothetical protein
MQMEDSYNWNITFPIHPGWQGVHCILCHITEERNLNTCHWKNLNFIFHISFLSKTQATESVIKHKESNIWTYSVHHDIFPVLFWQKIFYISKVWATFLKHYWVPDIVHHLQNDSLKWDPELVTVKSYNNSLIWMKYEERKHLVICSTNSVTGDSET